MREASKENLIKALMTAIKASEANEKAVHESIEDETYDDLGEAENSAGYWRGRIEMTKNVIELLKAIT